MSPPSRLNGPIFLYLFVTATVHTVMLYASSNFECAPIYRVFTYSGFAPARSQCIAFHQLTLV